MGSLDAKPVFGVSELALMMAAASGFVTVTTRGESAAATATGESSIVAATRRPSAVVTTTGLSTLFAAGTGSGGLSTFCSTGACAQPVPTAQANSPALSQCRHATPFMGTDSLRLSV